MSRQDPEINIYNMKPNRKQTKAVENTIVQWIWHKANPEKSKTDYFEFKKIPLNNRPIFGCYLCEEWNYRCDSFGSLCPLGTKILCCFNNEKVPFFLWENYIDRPKQ